VARLDSALESSLASETAEKEERLSARNAQKTLSDVFEIRERNKDKLDYILGSRLVSSCCCLVRLSLVCNFATFKV